MWLADLRLKPMLVERSPHSGDEIAAIGVVIDMLELTSAALRKVTAGRRLVMRPDGERAVVEQRVARDPERNMLA